MVREMDHSFARSVRDCIPLFDVIRGNATNRPSSLRFRKGACIIDSCCPAGVQTKRFDLFCSLWGMMDALAIFNSLEALFWIVTGAVVAYRSRNDRRDLRIGSVAALWFLLFGISDVWEVFTGAWWRPWPLLLLKGICVTGLITCALIYRRISTRRP